jgi:hypothetical protein
MVSRFYFVHQTQYRCPLEARRRKGSEPRPDIQSKLTGRGSFNALLTIKRELVGQLAHEKRKKAAD